MTSLPQITRCTLLTLLLASIGVAQTSRPALDPAEQRRPGVIMLERIRQALTQLDLSSDQTSKIDQLINDAEQRLPELRRQAQIDPEGTRGKLQNFVQDIRKQIIATLNDQQRTKLRDLLEQNGTLPQRPPPALVVARPPATAPSQEQVGSPAPNIGNPAPDFDLQQSDGRKVNLSSFGKRVVVLFFGSFSSPSFRQRVPEIEALKQEMSGTGSVQWLVIYTREAHPAGGWEVERNHDDNVAVQQPDDISARTKLAQQTRETLRLSMPVAVDSMDDKTADAYGVVGNHFSNAAVVIGRDGTIVAYQKWADPPRLKEIIQKAIQVPPPPRSAAAQP
jgi:peroxiredoxin